MSCSEGQHFRNRTIHVVQEYGGAECLGKDHELATCNGDVECPIDCEWNAWDPWDHCSHTCGHEGMRHRARTHFVNATYGGANCIGASLESEECGRSENGQDCPIDCVWTEWSEWSHCTTTCTGGESTRSRTHNASLPMYGGAQCQDHYVESLPCNEHISCSHTSVDDTSGSALPVLWRHNYTHKMEDSGSVAAAAGEEVGSVGSVATAAGEIAAAVGAIMVEKGSMGAAVRKDLQRHKASSGRRTNYVTANGISSKLKERVD